MLARVGYIPIPVCTQSLLDTVQFVRLSVRPPPLLNLLYHEAVARLHKVCQIRWKVTQRRVSRNWSQSMLIRFVVTTEVVNI